MVIDTPTTESGASIHAGPAFVCLIARPKNDRSVPIRLPLTSSALRPGAPFSMEDAMRTAIPLTVLATALACSLASVPAYARARVFVASYGDDANPCTFGSPCKTFQHAHDAVDAGGEVTAIDSAGFGPITINKAVTITSPDGVEAGIVAAAGGNAITITAAASDDIVLRGLTVDGAGVAFNGIVFISGGSLTVINCTLQNFLFNPAFNPTNTPSGNGILMRPSSGSFHFAITNTIMSNNDSTGFFYIPPSGSTATSNSVLDHVTALNSGASGIVYNTVSGGGATTFSITNSISSNSGADGFLLVTGTTPMTGSVDNVTASNNGTGVLVQGVAKVTLSRSIVTANTSEGVHDGTSAHTFYTFGNNQIALNNPDNTTVLNNATFVLH